MHKTLIKAMIGGYTDVYVCGSCGEYFSVITFPNNSFGEPEANNHPYIKFCPVCGCGPYDKNSIEENFVSRYQSVRESMKGEDES